MKNALPRSLNLILGTIAVLASSAILFQNCTPGQILPGSSTNKAQDGGAGSYDGKVYEIRLAGTAVCPDGETVEARIVLIDGRVFLARDNCRDLLGGREIQLTVDAQAPPPSVDYLGRTFAFNPIGLPLVLGRDPVATFADSTSSYFVDRRAIAKMSADGKTKLWAKKFPDGYRAFSAARLSSGGVVLVGGYQPSSGTVQSAFTAVLDSTGAVISLKSFGNSAVGSASETLTDVAVDANGDLILAGESVPTGSTARSSFLARVGVASVVWHKRFSPNADSYEGSARVSMRQGGDVYALSGQVIRRITPAGQTIWARLVSNPAASNGVLRLESVHATADGGLLLGGGTISTSAPHARAKIAKLDGNAALVSARDFQMWTNDSFNSVFERDDGKIVAAGRGDYINYGNAVPVHFVVGFTPSLALEWSYNYFAIKGPRSVLGAGVGSSLWLADLSIIAQLLSPAPAQCPIYGCFARSISDQTGSVELANHGDGGTDVSSAYNDLPVSGMLLLDVENELKVY